MSLAELSALPTLPTPRPAAPGRGPAAPMEVTILHWPAQEDLRQWLAVRRQPRLLLVADEADAPEPLDDLEDWVRGDLGPIDEAARCRALLRRADSVHATRPVVDADGLLRFEDRWVVIPETQIAIVELLVDQLTRVVPLEEFRRLYVAAGGSGHPNSIRTVIARLGRRTRSVGLELVTIRGRGLLLAVDPDCGRS